MSQVGQSTRRRPLTQWVAIILLLGLSVSGFNDASDNVRSLLTTGQKVATAVQFGHSLMGLIAIGALLARSRWTQPVLWIWAALIALTAGFASVVWGGSGPVVGLVAGVASAAIAALVVWLALRGTERRRGGEPKR
jgi:hypothetical protein